MGGALTTLNSRIIDQCQDCKKLRTIEAQHISRRKPQMIYAGRVQKWGINTEILSAECMFCLEIFELPCGQRYIVDQKENLLFKIHTKKRLILKVFIIF